jgi:hypothetical protein
MERLEVIVIACTIATWALIALSTLFVRSEMLNEMQITRDLAKDLLKSHQDWLFNQLYSMSPGKVLKPDEVEPVSKGKPATVIHTSRDPYNEFNGKMDDWR